MSGGKILLSTAYFGDILYFKNIIDSDSVVIEACESYSKQSFRNRAIILTANGTFPLVVPVHKSDLITNVRICYQHKWYKEHREAIASAYNSSPFYQFYEDDFSDIFIKNRFEFLFEMNRTILGLILKLTGITKFVDITKNYIKEEEIGTIKDFRNTLNPKNKFLPKLNIKYNQVFEHKFGFVDNLSILDILFNKGPETAEIISNASYIE